MRRDGGEREEALDALTTDLTKTARRGEILDRLVNGAGADAPEGRPLEVVTNAGSGTFTYPDYREIVFDPGDVGRSRRHEQTPERIFAHQLGHLIGYHDNGIGGLNNILVNKNPIMNQLGEPFARTRSEAP